MFKLQFATSNAAFDDCPASEIARILRAVAHEVETGWIASAGGGNSPIRDANGNTIGVMAYRPEGGAA